MTTRQEMIRQQIEDGREAKERLDGAEAEYERGARRDAHRGRAHPRGGPRAGRRRSSRSCAEQRPGGGRPRLAREQRGSRSSASRSSPSCAARSASIAVELAGRIVGESLSDDARQRRVVERFIADLESGEAARGQAGLRAASQRWPAKCGAQAARRSPRPASARRGARIGRRRGGHRHVGRAVLRRPAARERVRAGPRRSATPAPTRRPPRAARARCSSAGQRATLRRAAGRRRLRWSSARDLVDARGDPRRPGGVRGGPTGRHPRRGRGRAVPLRPDRRARARPCGPRCPTRSSPSTASGDLLHSLLGGQGQPGDRPARGATSSLAPRGRTTIHAVDELANQAAQRRQREIAVVRVAAPLDEELKERLASGDRPRARPRRTPADRGRPERRRRHRRPRGRRGARRQHLPAAQPGPARPHRHEPPSARLTRPDNRRTGTR